MSTSAAYQYATAPGGIGLDQMNQNIINFFAGNPDEAAARAAMQQYGVSEDDIRRATGKALSDYYPSQPAEPMGGLNSIAYQNAISEGGIGLDAMNQNIQSFLAANPTEQATRDAMQQYGVSEEDIQRATGKSFADYYPTVTGATGNDSVSADPDVMITDYQGNQYKASQLTGLASQIAKSFDPKSTGGVYGVGTGQSIGFDYDQSQKLFGEGKSPTVGDQVVLDIARGLLDLGITDLSLLEGAQKTIPANTRGGAEYLIPDRPGLEHLPLNAQGQRVLRGSQQKGIELGETATGQGKTVYYVDLSSGSPVIRTEAIDTSDRGSIAFGLTMLTLGMGGPAALGSTLTGGAATGLTASAIGSGALSFANGLVMGKTPIEALKDGVKTGGTTFLAPTLASMVPAELGDIGKRVVTQLVTTGKINPTALATAAGMDYAAGALSAETGIDKATASKLITAGYQVLKGNEIGALSTLIQPTRTSTTGATSGTGTGNVIDEYNVVSGGLSTSANPAEDELISQQQRITAANQAIADYLGSGNDLSREGLVGQLTNLVGAEQANTLAAQADATINQRRVSADVINRYSKVDPEFGTPALARDVAVKELEAAGFKTAQANDILDGVDRQVQAARTTALDTAAQNQAAINAGAGEFADADQRAAIAAGAGEFTGADKSAAVNASIANAASFDDAYAIARKEFGPNATFNYQGKLYSTATAQERPDLTGATKPTTADLGTPYVAPNGMHNRAAFIQAGGGTSDADYAKYVNAVNALVAEGKSGTLIQPSSVNSEGKDLPSTKGPVTMATPRVDSFLGSVAAQGVSSFGANSIGGVLNALGFTDAGRAVMDKANMIASAATAAEGADVTKGKADINSAISKVGDSTSLKDLATNIGNLASTVYNNPKAFGATVGSEVVEEVLQLATLKGLPGGFWVKETVASAIENGGAAYNQEFESQLAKGATPEVAHANAQKAAGVAAGTTVALAGAASGVSKLAGALSRSADDVAGGVLTQGKEVGKTLVKESAQEAVEEGSIAAGVDMALRGSIDAKNMLTAMTGGALYGGPTSSTMQATGADKLDPAAISSNVSVQIEDAASKGISLTDATNSAIASSMNMALESGQSITAIGPAVITGALDSGADLSSVINSAITVGINTGTDPSITTGTIVSSAVVAGLDQGADSTVVIGGAVTSSINAATKAASDVNATATSSVATSIATAAKSGVDVNAATTAAVDAATKAGVDVNVNTATEGGVTTTTAVSGNTTTAVAVDTNNGTTTTITNSGNTTTQIVSDQSSTVTTTVNTNTATVTETDTTTNITTTTKISQNTQTVTTVDPTTATKTETKTDLTTGQSTTVTTDLNTNTSTTTNTSTDGEDTIPGGQDTIPGGEDTIPGGDVVISSESPVVTTDITPPPITTTPEPTKTTKPPPVGPAASGAGFLLGSGMGMPSPEDWLGGKLLGSQTREKYINPLAQYFAEVQDLPQAPIAPEPIEEEMRLPYYTYGQEPSLDEIFGGTDTGEEDEPMYQAGGQVMNPQFMYAKGGLSREDFREGKHVSGPGDGQSDDIPAMLADGEFVFPADVVAALGNGSTKAGTEKLYEMMHAIRARARSNKPKDLPPPALKSPLDYLKKR